MANPVNFPKLRNEPEQNVANIGDLVQWTSGGVDQFETPKRVRRVQMHEGQEWAFVEGTETAVRMSELTIVTPASADATAPPMMVLSDAVVSPLMGEEREWLRGSLSRDTNYRLIVSGNLGPKEIGKLIKLLQAQKAILDDDID